MKNKKNQTRKNYQGFTLIEMMIVVVIMAILVTIAVPSFTDFFAKSRVKNATEAIHGFLVQAKSESINRDQGVYVDIQSGALWCLGFIPVPSAAPNTTCDCSAGTCTALVGATAVTQVISSVEFPNVAIASTAASTSFSRERGTADPDVDITTSSGGWALETRVTESGSVSTCKPTAGANKGVTGYAEC